MQSGLLNRFGVWVILLLSVSTVMGQISLGPNTHDPIIIIAPTFNYLYSTHSTKFQGFGLNCSTQLNGRLEVGLGTDLIDCPYHHDNGLELYHLKLVPIYGLLNYKYWGNRIWQPYAKVAIGITFMDYKEQNLAIGPELTRKSERGLNAYAGVGTRAHLAKSVEVFLDAGLTGYKMSFRALDINPHGIAAKTGLLFNL
ncbi:MAG TPA: hypothetical protein VL053_06615 [Arachidicoccus sp.]|nr:hypothetical protein [Arachidicoccus sp.]